MKVLGQVFLVLFVVVGVLGLGISSSQATVDSLVVSDASCSSITATIGYTRYGTAGYEDLGISVYLGYHPGPDRLGGVLYELPESSMTGSTTVTIDFAEQPEGSPITLFVNHYVSGVGFIGDPMVYIYMCAPAAEEEEETEAAAEPVPGCDTMLALSKNAVVGSFVEPAVAHWGPHAMQPTEPQIVIPAGNTAWVLGMDASGAYYQIIWSCDYLWVPASAVGPNYDDLWQGAPLPVDVVG